MEKEFYEAFELKRGNVEKHGRTSLQKIITEDIKQNENQQCYWGITLAVLFMVK